MGYLITKRYVHVHGRDGDHSDPWFWTPQHCYPVDVVLLRLHKRTLVLWRYQNNVQNTTC